MAFKGGNFERRDDKGVEDSGESKYDTYPALMPSLIRTVKA